SEIRAVAVVLDDLLEAENRGLGAADEIAELERGDELSERAVARDVVGPAGDGDRHVKRDVVGRRSVDSVRSRAGGERLDHERAVRGVAERADAVPRANDVIERRRRAG